MKYKYGDIDNVKKGDVIERMSNDPTEWTTTGKLYIAMDNYRYRNDNGNIRDIFSHKWKLILSEPPQGIIKKGTKLIRIGTDHKYVKQGTIYAQQEDSDKIIPTIGGYLYEPRQFHVLITPDTTAQKDEWVPTPNKQPIIGDYVRAIKDVNTPDLYQISKGDIHQISEIVPTNKNIRITNIKSWWTLGVTWELVEKANPFYEDNICETTAPDFYPEINILPIITTTTKEHPMNPTTLKLLLDLMTGAVEAPKDATNSEYVGIMTDANNQYKGYVYADSKQELNDIAAIPANEGSTIHIFKFNSSITQKPREVIEVERAGKQDD